MATVNYILRTDKTSGSLRLSGERPGTKGAFWRGNAYTFRVYISDADGNPYDLSAIQSISMKIRCSNGSGSDILAEGTVVAASFGTPASETEFEAGTDEHASFPFTDAEMNFPLLGDEKRRVWVVFSGITGGGATVTFAAGWALVYEDNDSAASAPPDNPGTTITVEQGDARYVKVEDNAPATVVEDPNLTIDGGLIS